MRLPNVTLVPTEPDAEEREKVRVELRAVISELERLLDEHLQVARVVEGKELGRHAGALSVARARIGIKNDLHGWALRVGARLGLLRAAD